MYAGGRGNLTARRFARWWIRVIRLGVLPRRWVVLEVPGRHTGAVARFPLGMADVDNQWYLVSMLGENSNWVKDVRAAGGRATLRRCRARCQLLELPVDQRPRVIRRYLQKAPGGRPHIPVQPTAALSEFEAVTAQYPVFQVIPDRALPAGEHRHRRQHRELRR